MKRRNVIFVAGSCISAIAIPGIVSPVTNMQVTDYTKQLEALAG